MKKNIEEILMHYLICAVWTEEENLKEEAENEPDVDVDNITEESKAKALKDIELFLSKAGNAVDGIKEEMIGHDLWLTRNGHGAGFWDRGYDKEVAEKLTEIAKGLGTQNLYIGDDNKLHF